MKTEDLLELVSKAAGAMELSHVTTFRGYRKDKKGVERTITVELLDSGPSDPAARYTVVATGGDGREATGNPVKTPEAALARYGGRSSTGRSRELINRYRLGAGPHRLIRC